MQWRVLIVDDDRNFRYAMREVIPWKAHGFEVAGEAMHGKQALEILKEKEIHIILTDMEMPVMNGVELTAAVKEQYPDILVFALSAYDDFAFVKESMKLGAKDYFLKQEFDGEQIIENLEKFCSQEIGRRRQELGRNRIQREILDYIQGKRADLPKESGFYQDLLQRRNLALYLVQSGLDAQIQPDKSLVYFMKNGGDLWVFLYQMDETRSRSTEIEYRNRKLAELCRCFPGDIHVGVCDCNGSFQELPDMYQRADEALRFYLYFPEKKEFHDTDMMQYEKKRIKDYLYPVPEDILGEHPEKVEEVLEELVQNLMKYMPKEEAADRNFLHVYQEYRKGLGIREDNLEGIRYYEGLKQKKTIAEKLAFSKEKVHQEIKQYQSVNQKKHPEIRKALEFIGARYAEDISLRDISEYVGLSENYFSNLFKQETGENLTTYINRVRIEKAKKLLEKTSMKVYEVARAVGYRNSTYFSTMFRKVAGMSISEYRAGVIK